MAGESSTAAAPAAAAPEYKLPHQKKVQEFYDRSEMQIGIGAVILFNFFAIVIEKEIDPYETDFRLYGEVWDAIDIICNIIFLFELAINLYGNWWRKFVGNGWNYLDTVVVVVGVMSLASMAFGFDLGPVGQIKILRAFRVLRLFKRVESLNKILNAIIRSIPGVMNAFVVMLIFMAIFAIMACDLFREFGDDGTYTTIQRYGAADAVWGQGEGLTWSKDDPFFENTTVVSAMTARGFHFGQEYYGTFFRSLYTLFQVLTGESWSEAVVRPLLFGWSPANAFFVGTFFTLYILITQVVLQNVVVAVLLDKFVQEDPEEEKENEANAPAAAPASASSASADVETGALAGAPAIAPAERLPAPSGDAADPATAEGLKRLRTDVDQIMSDQKQIAEKLDEILKALHSA